MKKHAPIVSIDASRKQIEAVRTCQGKPEERQVLLCGGDGKGVCTWQDGDTYESDVSNLTIKSREAAKVAVPEKRKKKKKKGKAAKKAKAKGAAKAKAPTTADDEDGEDDSDDADESSEEEGAEQAGGKDAVPAEEGKGAAGGGPVVPKGVEVPQEAAAAKPPVAKGEATDAKPKQAGLHTILTSVRVCVYVCGYTRIYHPYMRACGPHDPKLRGSLSKTLLGATRQSDSP
jgi:hypothetical protein